LRNLTVHRSEDDAVLVYSKTASAGPSTGAGTGAGTGPDTGPDTVIVVVNVDPHGTRETMVHLDMPALGLAWGDSFQVHDELTDETWTWTEHSYVRLDPSVEPAHILAVRRPR